jgi:hypothetical protein
MASTITIPPPELIDLSPDSAHIQWRYEQVRKAIPDPSYQDEIAMLERSLQTLVATPAGMAPAGLSEAGVANTIARIVYLKWAAEHQHLPTGGHY